MLEGCRTNLLQAGFPQQYRPLAMQHFAHAHNVLRSLGHEETPWERRFDQPFTGPLVPFGAKVLFYNNPHRPDHSTGKTGPTSSEGVFLGYHVQPGHAWKGEYLVAKLEAVDYHVENNSLSIQRVRPI